MSLNKNQWWVVGIGLALLVVILLLILGVIPGLKKIAKREVNLNFWGFDDRRIWQDIISEYQKDHPEIKIQYTQVPVENYENVLLNGLAGKERPDFFMFQHNWLPKHLNKVTAADNNIINIEQLRALFPSVVEQDFAPDGSVYALPLYIDTLSLFYNKDILDKKGIAVPPSNWLEFQEMVRKLGFGSIAIGGSNSNIDRATDILNLIMLQNGLEMVNKDFSRATFAVDGIDPFLFYTKFSNPESEYYVWNKKQPNSIESFIQGKLAMMFGYRYHARFLQEQNPSLNFALVPAPQNIINKVDYPFYYGLAVSANSVHAKDAWDFIIFATTKPEISLKYLEYVGELPALRTLISQYGNNTALTARSWLKIDDLAIDDIFSEMIESVMSGNNPKSALNDAERIVTQLMSR